MAKEFYDWIKLALDNKWLIMLCFTGLSSIATNAAQFVTIQDKEAEKNMAVREVTTEFQKMIPPIKPTKVIVRSNCNECGILLNAHEKRLH